MSGPERPLPSREPGPARESWVAVIGNPNVGKSTLFNALTGGSARVGNYPGVTVEKTVGTLQGAPPGVLLRLLDLPGTYSLAARSPDEAVAVDVLLGRRADTPRPDAVLVVADAANLQRNLYLLTQVVETGLPVVLALNLMDDALGRGIRVDVPALSAALGLPVLPTVASRGEGVDALREALLAAPGSPPPPPLVTWPPAVREAEELLRRAAPALAPVEARRALFDVGGEAEQRFTAAAGASAAATLAAARGVLAAAGPAAGVEAGARYGSLAPLVARTVARPAVAPVTTSDRIDAVLTHKLAGTLALVGVMTLVFVSIFAWSEPLMTFIEERVFGPLGDWVGAQAWLGEGLLKSLVRDGIVAGTAGVLVFLPQIVILFGFIALLEGCGYMARAAFLMDRLLRGVGLSGRSFIPMLSSFACAIPGIMAARTIESRRDRLATILIAPLMSCSARIPVYVILIAAFVPQREVLGVLNLHGLVFAAMYFVGILVAIPVAWVLKRTLLRGDTPSFLVELPPYRLPQLRLVLQAMWRNGRAFVVRAGTLILATSILIWALSTFPRHPDPGAAARADLERFDAEAARAQRARDDERARQVDQVLPAARAQGGEVAAAAEAAVAAFERAYAEASERAAAEREARVAEGEALTLGERLRHSLLGRLGHAVEPVFAPIGWDWKVGMAVIASFPAREVVVSTLGVIYNLGDAEDEESEPLREQLRQARWESGPKAGQPVFTLATALALMVFFALCAQCAATLVTIRREAGGWGWAVFTFVYMTLLAWVGAWLTASVVRALS